MNIEAATGNGCPYVASVAFTVPQVESGTYWVDVCADADCTIAVGDLVGGMIAIASTRLEARALTTLPDLKARLRQVTRMRHVLNTRFDSLHDALQRADENLGKSRAEASDAKDATDAAMAARDGLFAEAESAREAAYVWRSVAIGSLLVLGLTLMYSWAKVLRRRRIGLVLEAGSELVRPQQEPDRRVHR